MENEQLDSMQEHTKHYNETAPGVEEQHQTDELPMGPMENEQLESMQEHTQQLDEKSDQSEELSHLTPTHLEKSSRQSKELFRKKQV